MLEQDIDKIKLSKGEYCRKGLDTCFCLVGRPYGRMCPNCRDTREKWDNKDYCVCEPDDVEVNEK